jgi:hypothetical protein
VDEIPTKRGSECGAEGCTPEITLSWEEADAVDHGGRDLWIVAPGHELRGAPTAATVRVNERFSVIRGVEEHDP